ncbi:MAG: hypothetical protein ABJC39_06185 [Chloroflexota bacterium]
MNRIVAAILLIAVLAIGGGIVATSAYQAGLTTALTTATASGATVVAPVVPPYGYGYGWHPDFGFGIFGFLGTLVFVFIVFALLRMILWGGRARRGWGGPSGWGGPGGWDGPAGDGRGHAQGGSPWASRAHDTFEDWHRRAHTDTPPESGSSDASGPPPSQA